MLTLGLDAGHGGKDSGAIGLDGVRMEKDDSYRLRDLIIDMMRERPYKVNIVTMGNVNTYNTLKDRSDFYNDLKCDLVISLHRNGWVDGTAFGYETWLQEGTTNSNNVGDIVHYNICNKFIKDRGIKYGNYHILRETIAPSVLVELGFISNVNDNLSFDNQIIKIADSIIESVVTYAGIKDVFDGNGADWVVQSGRFANYINAVQYTEELRKKGVDSFVRHKSEYGE